MLHENILLGATGSLQAFLTSAELNSSIRLMDNREVAASSLYNKKNI